MDDWVGSDSICTIEFGEFSLLQAPQTALKVSTFEVLRSDSPFSKYVFLEAEFPSIIFMILLKLVKTFVEVLKCFWNFGLPVVCFFLRYPFFFGGGIFLHKFSLTFKTPIKLFFFKSTLYHQHFFLVWFSAPSTLYWDQFFSSGHSIFLLYVL